MDTAFKAAIVSVFGVGAFGIAIAFLNRFFAIRSARPAAAATFMRKIELAIPYDNARALRKNPILALEDAAAFKAHLWFWQVRILNTLWREYDTE